MQFIKRDDISSFSERAMVLLSDLSSMPVVLRTLCLISSLYKPAKITCLTFHGQLALSRAQEAKAIMFTSWSCYITRSYVLRTLTGTEKTSLQPVPPFLILMKLMGQLSPHLIREPGPNKRADKPESCWFALQ